MESRLLSAAGALVGLALVAAMIGPVRPAVLPSDTVPDAAFYQRLIKRIEAGATQISEPVQLSFAPGTPDEVVSAVTDAIMAPLGNDRFFVFSRWGATALQPVASPTGNPVTLTYSFVPDGTPVRNLVGFGDGVSGLFARMDAIYGNTAAWQNIYHGMFARWGELTGVIYVFEPNDDGAPLFDNPGVANVRGDLRMSGKPLDGNSGVLAFNPFPQNGDMVIDTTDDFFENLVANSLPLRNTISHEHGHGLGILHVCPANQTKLMEPFINGAFDTVQHDDIRAAHRHYGDINEPDDFPATATDLGLVDIGTIIDLGVPPAPFIANGATLSLDIDEEQDWYKITIPDARRISIDLTPIGTTYDSAGQLPGGGCGTGGTINTLTLGNLAIQIFGPDMVSLVASSTSAPAGEVESLFEALLPSAGDYFIGVFETQTMADVQLYTMSIEILDSFRAMQISFPSGVPSTLEPGVPTTFQVQITPRDETLLPASPTLNFRYDGGSFLTAPLVSLGGGLYDATFPAPLCDATPEFFISAEGAARGVVNAPLDGATGPFSAAVGISIGVASFNFETDTGWTVDNDAGLTSGAWEIGIPIDCTELFPISPSPTADFDASGQCFLTDNSQVQGGPPPRPCNDVDGGETRLISPVFDITGLLDPTVSYARWYDNSRGAEPQADTFVVEFSDDGGSIWVPVEVVGPTTLSPIPDVEGGWVQKSFRVADFVGVTSQFRVRFSASDFEPGSFVEAGIDAFSIDGLECDFVPPFCLGDADGDGQVNFSDITSVLSNWLNDYTPGTGPGDANGDGLVNFADITVVLSNWLAPCGG